MARHYAGSGFQEPHGEIFARLWMLFPLRLYVGFHFVVAAWSKVSLGMLSDPQRLYEGANGFKAIIERSDYPYAFYRAFFHGMIEPHPGVFAFLVIFGELLTGLAVLTGTLTRLACVGGIFMMANFYFAFDVNPWKAHNTTSFAVILFVLLLTGAGRAYGMDHYLRGKLPGWMA